MMFRLPVSSRKLADCTMFITFGVSLLLNCLVPHMFLLMELQLISMLLNPILGYKSLQDRKESRESAWRAPGWDECVAYTVPLIREMHTRILRPTDFSPTQ